MEGLDRLYVWYHSAKKKIYNNNHTAGRKDILQFYNVLFYPYKCTYYNKARFKPIIKGLMDT